jgi:hypothetical protein
VPTSALERAAILGVVHHPCQQLLEGGTVLALRQHAVCDLVLRCHDCSPHMRERKGKSEKRDERVRVI